MRNGIADRKGDLAPRIPLSLLFSRSGCETWGSRDIPGLEESALSLTLVLSQSSLIPCFPNLPVGRAWFVIRLVVMRGSWLFCIADNT